MKEIDVIYAYALEDKADSVCAAQVLLSLWDGQRYPMDLQQMLSCNENLFIAIKTTLSHLYVHKHPLNQYLTDLEMEPILARYGRACAIDELP